MQNFRRLLVLVLLSAALPGCKVDFSASPGQRYAGAGVVFIVPLETSSVDDGPAGIDYRGKSLTARTNGTDLFVNGKSFGSLSAGDVVDFTQPGVVKVNDKVREPSGT
jgi:hypothetical protein